MTTSSDYVTSPEAYRQAMTELTQLASPPSMRFGRPHAAAFFARSHNATCPACMGEAVWQECEQFNPAQLRGICHTMYVVQPWTQAGPVPAYVLDYSDGGPAAAAGMDLWGPFDTLPAAYRWAADVAATEIEREIS